MLDALPFAEIWAVDFEFGAEPGESRAGVPGRLGTAQRPEGEGLAG